MVEGARLKCSFRLFRRFLPIMPVAVFRRPDTPSVRGRVAQREESAEGDDGCGSHGDKYARAHELLPPSPVLGFALQRGPLTTGFPLRGFCAVSHG